MRIDANAGQINDGTIEKFCAGDCDAACDALGGLYQWAEALALPSRCNTESCEAVALPQRGICPEGYHVPTVEELAALVSTVEAAVGEYYAGNALRSTEGWRPGEIDPNGNGTDAYSFRVLPAGIYSPQLTAYFGQGESAYYWLSTNAPGGVATMRGFASGQRNVTQDTSVFTALPRGLTLFRSRADRSAFLRRSANGPCSAGASPARQRSRTLSASSKQDA